jgi:hypothetical protein
MVLNFGAMPALLELTKPDTTVSWWKWNDVQLSCVPADFLEW